MINPESRFNIFLVMERFSQLQQKNLEPKLGVYSGNRLVIASQKRTNLFAKIYQLFVGIIYNPLANKYGKLSFDENQITFLTNDIQELKGDVNEKKRVLTELTNEVKTKKQEFDNLNRGLIDIKEKINTVENELHQKNQALQELRAASEKSRILVIQLKDSRSKLQELSDLAKQFEPQERKMNELRRTIRGLETKKSELEARIDQLDYKKKVESQSARISYLQGQLDNANQPRNTICVRCQWPVTTSPRH